MAGEWGGEKLAIRIAALTILGGVLAVAGLLIATAAAAPPKVRGCWVAYAPLARRVYPSTNCTIPAGTVTYSGHSTAYHSSVVFHPYPVTAWWVVLLLVVGLGALWAGCAWLLLRPPRATQAHVDTTGV
jgi:hypothetical protein